MILNPFVFAQSLPADFVPVIFVLGQSNNAEGRAEADRLALTEFPDAPSRCKIYDKPDYTSSDNGVFKNQTIGVYTKEPDLGGTIRVFGAASILGQMLARYLNRRVYEIMIGDGGTALEKNLTNPDWDPTSVGECFVRATQYFYTPAMTKIEAAEPGKTLVPIITWHQGEADAIDSTAITNYAANFSAFVTALRSYEARLSSALLFITKLNYNQNAGETSINAVFDAYGAANSLVYVNGPYDRKIDLTVGEQGGFSPTASDDNHTSYLGQIAKATDIFNSFVTHYGLSGNSTEITSNTAFDPSTLSANYYRLQMNRSNVTIGSDNIVSTVASDLSGSDWVGINNPRFKVNTNNKGYIYLTLNPTGSNQRIEGPTANGTTLFARNNYSFGGWFKFRDGHPANAYTLFHDIQNTTSVNNSRVLFSLLTDGNLQVIIAVGGTAVTARTASPAFSDDPPEDEHHIAFTVGSSQINIYVDGSLLTLDGTLNGDLSALTLTNYVNTTNKPNVGARRSGASTYADFYYGLIREVTLQPVTWSAGDITNLMLN